MNIGEQSIDIAQQFFKSISLDTLKISPIQQKEQAVSKENISTDKTMSFIAEIVHDNSISNEVKVSKVKELLITPRKVQITLANSEYISSIDTIGSKGSNPQKGYYVQQSIIVGDIKEQKGKENIPKEQDEEYLMDSMFDDPIFNKIQEKKNLSSIPIRVSINVPTEKIQQTKINNHDEKEQMRKLVNENARLKQQISKLNNIINSIQNELKSSFNISINKSSSFAAKRNLTQSILLDISKDSDIKILTKFYQPLKIQVQMPQNDSIHTDLNVIPSNNEIRLSAQLQKQQKINTQHQSEISHLKRKIHKIRSKQSNILQYIHQYFQKIINDRQKMEKANSIITQVSMYIRK